MQIKKIAKILAKNFAKITTVVFSLSSCKKSKTCGQHVKKVHLKNIFEVTRFWHILAKYLLIAKIFIENFCLLENICRTRKRAKIPVFPNIYFFRGKFRANTYNKVISQSFRKKEMLG